MSRLSNTLQWLTQHPAFTVGVIVAWIVVLVVSLWAVHHFLVTIPAEYFLRKHQPLERWRELHPVLRILAIVSKNLLGAVLIVAGIIMLFTPGQGILCLLLGVSLVDIPGKRALERRIVQRPRVSRLVNAMRAHAACEPLVFDGGESSEG